MNIMRMLKYFLKDEAGIEPATAALLGGGISMLGGLFKPKKKTVDPYSSLRGGYEQYLGGKMGTSTPYQYDPAFEIPKPEVESRVESGILGKLDAPPATSKDIMGISEKYYGARKSQMEARHEEELGETQAMYNRLGLVSSTPGMEAMEGKRETHGREFDLLEAEIMQDSITKEIEALALGEDIYGKYLGQGQILGQAQRGYGQYPIGMSQQDIARQTQEELSYASLIGSLIGGNPPQTYFEPSMLGQAAGGAGDAANLWALYSILGKD